MRKVHILNFLAAVAVAAVLTFVACRPFSVLTPHCIFIFIGIWLFSWTVFDLMADCNEPDK